MAGIVETTLDGFRLVVLPHDENDGKTIRAFRMNDRDEITDIINIPISPEGQGYLMGRLSVTNGELREIIEQETEEQRRKVAAELTSPLAGADPEAGRDGSSPSP